MTVRYVAAALVVAMAGAIWAAEGAPAGQAGQGTAGGGRPSLAKAMAALKVPPDWFKTVKVGWDVKRPWKEGRQEIRRLLAKGGESALQAVKLTWLYAEKGDIGDGHELPMYMHLSGQYAWAVREYPLYIKRKLGKGAVHARLGYASVLSHFGEYDKALAQLAAGEKDLPKPPWRIRSLANIHDRRGDIYARMGKTGLAKRSYRKAVELLPKSKQPYGRHLLRREAGKIQTKLDLLTMKSLADAKLRDGTYVGRSLGYAKDIVVTVTVAGGRIADVTVKHQEKIELNATKIIPRRIVAGNTLKVDSITGATVTSQAIVDGAFRALKRAGLE